MRSDILFDEIYVLQGASVIACIRESAVHQLAQIARSYIKISKHVRITGQFYKIGDATNYKLITTNSVIAKNAAGKLSVAQSPFRRALNEAHAKSGIGLTKAQKLADRLSERILGFMASSGYGKLITSISTLEIYRALSQLLSIELYAKADSNSSSATVEESVALNFAILVYHFERWHMPANEFIKHFKDFDDCKIGMRGYLISIEESHSAEGNKQSACTQIPAFSPLQLSSAIYTASDLLAAVSDESHNIFKEQGFFHRIIPVDSPVDFRGLPRVNGVDQKLIEAGRRLLYPQYENTALVFMSLAAIEFLVRSCAPCCPDIRDSVETITDNWIELPSDVKNEIKSLFSSRGLNARNRCMHGAFLEIEGRRADLTRASGLLLGRGVPQIDLTADDSLPVNLSAIVLSILSRLVGHIDRASIAADTTWCNSLLLSPEDMHKVRGLKRDMLVDANSCEEWRRAISKHLEKISPALSIPIKMGILAWSAQENKAGSMPKIYFLSLLFEPLVRLTLHAHGRNVLQQKISGDGSGGSFFSIKYRMLDENGLLSVDNIKWMTSHLSALEAEAAAEVLRLAVKCRNALAHGAVTKLSDDIRENYSHTIIKAIQLVVERTMAEP